MIENLTILIFALMFGALFCACHWYYYNVFKPTNLEQEVKPTTQNPALKYKADYCNLLNTISTAKNIWELKLAKKAVASFRKRYKGAINDVSVENDVCNLNRHIENMEIALALHPTVLN